MSAQTRPRSAETEEPRRRSRPILLTIVGILMVAAGAVWALAELTDTSETVEQTTSSDGITQIVVSARAGDITITAEDRTDIEVSTELRSSLFSESRSEVEASDGTVTVTSDCDALFFAFNCSASHTIRVPADRISEIDLTTAAGTVAVTGASAEIDAQTTAGDIDILEFTGPSATLRTTAGGISVGALAPPNSISAQTTAGSIVIVVPDETYDVDTDTTAGDSDVSVRTDPSAERSISATTTAGSITISND